MRELDGVTSSMLRGKEDLKRLVARMQAFIDAPPITVNGQVLIYVWLKGLILKDNKGILPNNLKIEPPALPNQLKDFRLLWEPPR